MDLSTDVPDGVGGGVSDGQWGLYLQTFGRTSKSVYDDVCRCGCLNSIVIVASISCSYEVWQGRWTWSNQYLGWQGLYSKGGNSQIIVKICCNSLSTPANTTGFFDWFLFHERRNCNHILCLRSCGRSPSFCTTGPHQNAATSPKRSLWPRKSSKALRMKDHPKIRPGGVSRPTGWLTPCFYRFLGLKFHLETDPMWWIKVQLLFRHWRYFARLCFSPVFLLLDPATLRVRGSLATLPIGHLRPYPLKTRNTVTCDPTSFYCAHHTKLHLVTCDPTHHY